MLSSRSLFFQRAFCALLSLAVSAESAPLAFADMDEYGRVSTTELPRHRRYLPTYAPPPAPQAQEPARVQEPAQQVQESTTAQRPRSLEQMRQRAREAAELWRNSGDASRRIDLLPSSLLRSSQSGEAPRAAVSRFIGQSGFNLLAVGVGAMGGFAGFSSGTDLGYLFGAVNVCNVIANSGFACLAWYNSRSLSEGTASTASNLELLRAYFDELRLEGIAIPEGTLQEQVLWWETVNRVGAFEAGLAVTPASVAAQIQVVEIALTAILPKVSEEVQELLRELIDDLPSRRSFQRRLRPQRWMMSSLMKLYEVRARLAQIASTLDENVLKAIDAGITQSLIEVTRAQALSAAPESFRAFRSLDIETRDLLATSNALLLHTPTVLDHFQRSPDLLPIQISSSQVLAASGPGRLATYQSSVRVILDHDKGHVIEFTTRWNAPSNDLQTALQSGRWASSIASMLESKLAAAPWIELESQAQGCEATMLPVDHEDALVEIEEVISPSVGQRGSR